MKKIKFILVFMLLVKVFYAQTTHTNYLFYYQLQNRYHFLAETEMDKAQDHVDLIKKEGDDELKLFGEYIEKEFELLTRHEVSSQIEKGLGKLRTEDTYKVISINGRMVIIAGNIDFLLGMYRFKNEDMSFKEFSLTEFHFLILAIRKFLYILEEDRKPK